MQSYLLLWFTVVCTLHKVHWKRFACFLTREICDQTASWLVSDSSLSRPLLTVCKMLLCALTVVPVWDPKTRECACGDSRFGLSIQVWNLIETFLNDVNYALPQSSGPQLGCRGTAGWHLQYSGVPRVNTFFNIPLKYIFKMSFKSYNKLLCFATGRHKLFFSSVGCRNPEKVGKNCLNLYRLQRLVLLVCRFRSAVVSYWLKYFSYVQKKWQQIVVRKSNVQAITCICC